MMGALPIFLFVGCLAAPALAQVPDDAAQVEAWLKGYDAAFMARDLDRLATFYHPDVTICEGTGINDGWADSLRSLRNHRPDWRRRPAFAREHFARASARSRRSPTGLDMVNGEGIGPYTILAKLGEVAAICGIEEQGSTRALVMELVEGDDLSQRISRGALPLDEALPPARQIAEAFEAAHRQGIVHRDLKPGGRQLGSAGSLRHLSSLERERRIVGQSIGSADRQVVLEGGTEPRYAAYDEAPDGRFLMIQVQPRTRINVVLNRAQELKARTAATPR